MSPGGDEPAAPASHRLRTVPGMARWNDLLAALGNGGARRNAARVLDDRRRADEELDRFLARLSHPAGTAAVPKERRVA